MLQHFPLITAMRGCVVPCRAKQVHNQNCSHAPIATHMPKSAVDMISTIARVRIHQPAAVTPHGLRSVRSRDAVSRFPCPAGVQGA